jgi:N-hydroxyarylamine O-acetyltransferase
MDLPAYLRRIGVAEDVRLDLEGLIAIHRGHALSIPYENLDVQLGRPLTRAPDAAFDKIVARGRGGWCYEMNGLLASALDAIGFRVTRLAGAVMRDVMGDEMIGNHLVLLVDIDGETFIADVGFGDGLIEPIPLREGPVTAGPLKCHLSCGGDGWWRYTNDPRSGGPNFEFHPDQRGEADLDRMCAFLQTSEMSPFVQNAIVQRWREDGHYSLRGRVLRVLTATDESKRVLVDADDYVDTLSADFGLDLPEARTLWPKIAARHDALFSQA